MSTNPLSKFLSAAVLFGASVIAAPAFGQLATVPFEDGFESGTLAPYWTVNIPMGVGYATVSTSDGPKTGSFHLLMASSVDGTDSTAEAVLALDLAGKSGLLFEFSQREYGDEDDPEDGIWVSDDGVTWKEIFHLGLVTSSVYQTWSLDLDNEVAKVGMSYTTPFYIKFAWNDNFDIPTDGFGFDDIRIRSVDYETLETLKGPTTSGKFGSSMAPVGDYNTDGFLDYAIGYPGWSANRGRVEIRSGKDAGLLSAFTPSLTTALFGESMINIGDVDGDGKDELLIGAPGADTGGTNSGSAFVYSYATGQYLYTLNGSQGFAEFGKSVSGAGDLNGDGTADFLIGEPLADNGGTLDTGRIWAYSGATGAVLFSRFGVQAKERYGASISGVPDTNGDGVPDIVVGAPERSLIIFINDRVGAAEVISGTNGVILNTFSGDSSLSQFGTAVLGIEDADGDGLGDVAVGAPASGNGAGMVRFFSPDNFAVIDTFLGAVIGERFGFSLAHVGDITGDGLVNFAIGSDAASFGSATVYRAHDLQEIYRFEPLLGGTSFGNTIAGAGDINSDGLGDFMIGAPKEKNGSLTNAGVVRIVTTANSPVFEKVDGVHSTLSGDLIVRGQSLLHNMQVEIDGVTYPSVYVSPVEALVAIGSVAKGGFSDIRITTALGEDSATAAVPRFPALKSDENLALGGNLNVTLDNGDSGGYILAYSNQIFAAPADFSNFGWYYGLELAGVWMINAGGFALGDTERIFSLPGPSAANFVGQSFYLQAWTFQSTLGLAGFSNTTKFTIIP